MTEYPTLTALMAGREPGSVKVRNEKWQPEGWFRPGYVAPGSPGSNGLWYGMNEKGHTVFIFGDDGPWFIVAEDPALDTLRLEIAGRVLAAMHATYDPATPRAIRHAYALAEADALLAEARRTPSAEARK